MTSLARPGPPLRRDPLELEDPIPDAIEPITAFRVWRADLFLRLHSLNNEVQWQPDEWTVAECPWTGHRAPHEGCTCGLYAAKNFDFAMAIAAGVLTTTSPEDSMPTTAIVGRVELAGKVIEHARGYRAEHARVVEILPIEGRSRLTLSVASRFGVPVGEAIPASSVEAMMRRDLRRRRRALRKSKGHARSAGTGWLSRWLFSRLPRNARRAERTP
jgi:hypothetical protein